MSSKGPGRSEAIRPGHRRLSGLFFSRHGGPDAFGSERSFSPGIGSHWSAEGDPRGYYIDFRMKTEEPDWPPPWLAPLPEQMHVATAQWALGCFDRYLAGEGEEWLDASVWAGRHLLDTQHADGPQEGGWRHLFPMPHTYRINPPWLSSITQGEAASLFVRLHLETGEQSFAEAARRALLPMSVPVAEGGVLGTLPDGSPFVEEYPTNPASLVLNGAIFALWGFRDVGVGLGDEAVSERFDELVTALARNLQRWDTGFWSRYDLYPHPVPNLASPSYHLLHIHQLEVMAELAPRPEFEEYAQRFRAYRAHRANRTRAIGEKVAFRLLVPRNATLAHRMPWSDRPRRTPTVAPAKDDLLVICYHAVSPDWDAPLSVTPAALEAQLAYLKRRGYRGVTLSMALAEPAGGRRVAVTFDDGYRSVIERAKPILDRYEMPATLYVPTDYIGQEGPMSWPGIDCWLDGPFESELRPLGWEEVASLRAAGWEIGSHTCSHPHLTSLSDEALRAELERSRRVCEEHLGTPCESLAFPFGEFDERVMEATMLSGYANALALTAGTKQALPYCWPRVGIFHVDSMGIFRLKVSNRVRRLQGTSAWEPLSRLVRALRPSIPA